MTAHPKSGLSTTQQTMLDLALACDLKVSDTTQHEAIRNRHKAIQHQQDAAAYIHEVETKIHSRRKSPGHPKSTKGPVAPAGSSSGAPAKQSRDPRSISGTQAAFAILFLVVLMVAMGWFASAGLNLVLVTVSLLAMMVVLGMATTGRSLGILINERNVMSLARFQTALWTIIILGAYMTFAMVRMRIMATGLPGGTPIDDPLGIQMDWHLWALIGISTTSLVGAPLILSSKTNQEPTASATQKAAQMVNESAEDIDANRRGTLYANAKLSDARLTDMFEGDELINTARLDLAKVQMFYFTIIAAICFFVMVFKMLVGGGSNLDHLPALPDGFVAILGISHAGYLSSKGVTRTQLQP